MRNTAGEARYIIVSTPIYGRASVSRPPTTYLHQLRVDTKYNLEDQPEAMDDWERWTKNQKNTSCHRDLTMMMYMSVSIEFR